ncbi:MAG: hypothetical protein ABR875_00620 [Minisyncoccia bacterium]
MKIVKLRFKNYSKPLLIFLGVFLGLFCFVKISSAAMENLDEMMTRKARRTVNVFPSSVLEDTSNHYIWQPETLEYKDAETGHEVWKMSDSPNLKEYYQNDIGVSPWSADGKRMAFWTWDRNTAAFTGEENSYMWMLVDTDGKFLRPIVNGPSRMASGYFHWSPQIPDTYYDEGSAAYWPWSTTPKFDSKKIYKATVSDTDVSAIPLLTFNFNGPNISKYISPDGRKIIADEWVNDTDPHMLYPATIYPESQATVALPNGYSQWRNFGPYGGTPTTPTRYHDSYYVGDGSWFFGMPDIGATWWRIKALGSAPDGGALYTGDDGNHNFGEIWPEDHGSLSTGDISSPFVDPGETYNPSKTAYWSHFVPDMWGRYALFSNVDDGLPGTGTYNYYDRIGTSVWDIQKHQYVVPSFGGGAIHHDWHGFTDWTVSSSSGGPSTCGATGTWANEHILSQKYNDSTAQILVSCAHTAVNGGTDYNSIARPGQSPDGTKVAWHSEFLNPGANMTDIFWSVVMYPYPPTTLNANYSSGVNLSWLPPQYTNRGWPYASANPSKDALGWPLLDSNGNEIGETLYAREIDKYHIWRSTSQNGPWQEVGTKTADYSYTYAEDPTMFMLHPIANGLKVSPSNKIAYTDNPGNGTFYYALTSEEYSGLNSDHLSDILKVTVSGNSVSGSVVQSQGQKNFWTTPPTVPSGFSYAVQSNHGQYRLNWTQPNDTKIRYYNIYYSNSANPSAIQQQRIASVPVGTATYLDWLADSSATGHYGITSVDGYGNESAIILSNTPPPPTPTPPPVDTTPPAVPTGVTVQ